ncbi:MAG: WD40/YVTN/BNR-like repeat-containing protein, partial [Deltaproteobacteria bacterium]
IATGGGAVARVFRSTDYGRSWTASETPVPAGGSAGIFSLAFRDAHNGVAVGGDYAHPRAARANVALTTDGGRTWAPGDSAGVTAYLSGAAWLPGGSVVVAVGTEGAFESADGGRSWARRDTLSWNAVAALRRRGWVVAVGDGGRAGVWATPLGGSGSRQ